MPSRVKADSVTAPVIEIRCNDCNVSHPVGTKRCIHCGRKLGRTPQFGMVAAPTGPTQTAPQPVFEDAFEPATEEEEEEGQGPGLRLRLITGGIWVLLALIGSIYQTCQAH
jgi:hypothetical protein